MRNYVLLTTAALLMLCTGGCKKCYICRDRRSGSVNGVPYKTKERIRVCAGKIKYNGDVKTVIDYYEGQGYDCQLLTSGI